MKFSLWDFLLPLGDPAGSSARPVEKSPSKIENSALALLAAALAAQVLALQTALFQVHLNSDYLIAEFFSRALFDPARPVGGWAFGGGTFWFPDYLLFVPLRALCGDGGPAYAAYAVVWFFALAAAFAWSLVAAGAPRRAALLGTGVALNVLLAGRFLPHHDFWLWLLGVPGFHGGCLLNTFALAALVLGAARAGRWSRGRAGATFAVLALGLLANALLFMHAVLPLAAALLFGAWRTPAFRRVLAGYVALVALALAAVVAARWAFARAELFYFTRLFYEQPTLDTILAALGRFQRDAGSGHMAVELWGYEAAALVAIVVAALAARRAAPVPRAAIIATLLGLLLAWLTPIVTCVWHSAAFLRYEFNWFVAPAWLLTLVAITHWDSPRAWSRAGLLVAALALAAALPRIAPARWRYPATPGDLALLARCRELGFTEGLSGYWQSHRLTAAWRFAGPALGLGEADGRARFWCNNAFGFFPARPDGGLRAPRPQFILLDDLDAAGVSREYGGPFLVEHVGGYALARLTPEQSRLAGERVAARVREALAGRRARQLDARLGPAGP